MWQSRMEIKRRDLGEIRYKSRFRQGMTESKSRDARRRFICRRLGATGLDGYCRIADFVASLALICIGGSVKKIKKWLFSQCYIGFGHCFLSC